MISRGQIRANPRLEAVYCEYIDETDEEIERKRGVYRSWIVSNPRVQREIEEKAKDEDRAQDLHDTLTYIIRRRGRSNRRWEAARAVAEVLGVIVSFVIGVVSSDPILKWLGFVAS